jgi:uncharacterized protein involved in response to NO
MAVMSIHRVAPAAPALLSAGFRPFFLLAALWSAIAVPVWLAAYMHGFAPSGSLPAMVWHAHEMVYGFGLATVTGFLLTAVPNWTGRLPLRGAPLAALAALWLAGRIALLAAAPEVAAVLDLGFGAALIAVIAREVAAARNFHNYPIVAVLCVLLVGNLLVHLQALEQAYTAALGNRIGVATLLALIALIGGRIIPSFTRNWLAKARPDVAAPAQHSKLDWICLALTVLALGAWAASPDSPFSHAAAIAGGVGAGVRLARWRGLATLREPLVFVLHAGYAWLALGLLLLGIHGFAGWVAPGAPLHALTVGAIGTMTVAVMTRASLGHGGRPLAAGAGTIAIFLLVTLAALLRTGAALSEQYAVLTSLGGLAWSAAFALFAFTYGPLLLRKKT